MRVFIINRILRSNRNPTALNFNVTKYMSNMEFFGSEVTPLTNDGKYLGIEGIDISSMMVDGEVTLIM